ncbi:glutamate-rich protein 3 isoform X3 [Varanus komodoensis]|uniref:glutamate-rich protein 3 isoform X3 n=1 Tax=Varanus komodoensis TaxID=61221 RepID=UPI001CF78329|nr:glutamate-rich protein 3 isoform X3 [Varanus komodoensis]
MSHPFTGVLANYNSLKDKHLAGYFSNTRIRRHLQKSGLISRSGRIISEKEYRLNAMRKDNQKYIRECLAQAIFHKVLDMEHHHQAEIKRKLENSARRERVHRIKVERRRVTEESNHLLSPHPPNVPRNHFGRHKLANRGHSNHLVSYPRPSTAPGNIQHPIRLQPLYSNATTESAPKAALSSRSKFLTLEKEHHLASGGDKGVLNPMRSMDYSTGISPYRLPIINNYVTPIPPLLPPKSENINAMKGVTLRGRRFRPTTAPNGLDQFLMRDTGKFYKPQVQSNAYITMVYLGKTVHLSYDLLDYREEIKIYQQHCGGENVCVYRGKLLEGETFQFISKRHYGFPFSLTFYLNGIQVDRLSSCCEYKHRKGTRLGGKHGYFGFINVERSSPCYRCIIAMGLDRKPSPPKKKVTDDETKKEDSWNEDLKYELRESSGSSGEEKNVTTSLFSPMAKEQKESVKEIEWETRKGAIQKASDDSDAYESSQKRLTTDAYDEDFETDNEKSDGKVNEEGQADDQMNAMSKSPKDDEKHNLDHERENTESSRKALQASESEQDESDGYGESDLEEEDKQDRKHTSSLSSRTTTLYSSENDSECETEKQEDEHNTDIQSEYENETTTSQREGDQETDVEEEETMGKVETTTTKCLPSAFFDNEVESNLKDMSPVNEKPKSVGSVDRNTREDGEENELVNFKSSTIELEPRSKEFSKDVEEGDSKSVKEKIAEVIGNEQLLGSEPEASDSSTEDEVEVVASAQDKHTVPDGVSLTREVQMLESQKVTEQVEQEDQMVGKGGAPEEEKLIEEEVPKEAAWEEELLAPHEKMEQPVKNELVLDDLELKKEVVVESDLNDVEKQVMYEEGESLEDKVKTEQELKEPKETLEYRTFNGHEISEEWQLQWEEVDDQHIIEEFMAFKEEKSAEVTETSEVLGTMEIIGQKTMVVEANEAKEVMEEAPQKDEALEVRSVKEDTFGDAQKHMEEDEHEGRATLKDIRYDVEVIEKDSSMEDRGMEEKFLKVERKEEGNYVKMEVGNAPLEGLELKFMDEGKFVKLEVGKAPLVDPELKAQDVEVKELITIDEKGTVSEEKSTGNGNELTEVPSDVEEVVQEVPCTWNEQLEKTFPEVSEMKNACIEDDSMLEEQESWLEAPLQVYETGRLLSATEEETMYNQRTRGIIEKEEQSAGKANSGGETAHINMVVTEEEENLVQAVEGESTENPEQGRSDDMGISKMADLKNKWGIGKQELLAQIVPETIASVTEETTWQTKAERKVAVEGEAEVEEAEREVEIETERENEEEKEEVEMISVITGHEGDTVSEMTIMRSQHVVTIRKEKTAEAKHIPEVALGRKTLNKEEIQENEANFQDKEEQTEETSIFLVQNEEITVQEENEETEDEESDGEEHLMSEEIITLADVKEALLIGIQQLITEVSQMKREEEEKEEEPQMEGVSEKRAPQDDAVNEDIIAVMVAKERWDTQSDKAEEGEIGDYVGENPLEGKCENENRTTTVECPTDSVTVTRTFLKSGKWSERYQHQEPVDSSD